MPNVNFVLPDNSFFQRNNAIIAHIANQNGPYPRAIFDAKLHGFQTITNSAEVIAGDFCNSGNERGVVSSITNSGGILTINVAFESTKPAGISVADWRIATTTRTVVYKYAIVAAAGVTPNRVVFESLDNQGCIFYRPVNELPEVV